MKDLLELYDVRIESDNIIRSKDKKPKCPNDLLQPLVIKKKKEKLTQKEDYLYGCLLYSLCEILINNKHFKFKNQEEKDELRDACILKLCEIHNKYDESKGSTAYSYFFHCGYTAMLKKALEIAKIEKKKKEIEEILDLYKNNLIFVLDEDSINSDIDY